MDKETFTNLDDFIKKPIQVKLPAELSVRVDYFAKKFNCSPQAVVRIAVSNTLTQWEEDGE